jgi:BirA family biotin operon repressor/biotin-[acetyl-CoA-carboxylase] ligase
MLLIKLDATDSTNAYLKDLLVSQNPPDGTVVQTDWQKKGRGQLGRQWLSEPGKNLTISILKKFDNLKVSEQFVLSIITSLAIVAVLNKHQVPDIKVKWPNDILSGKQKLCGILVENVVKGALLKSAIIGIGLNVNQERFGSGLNATSVKILTGNEIPLELILQELVEELETTMHQFLDKPMESAQKAYEKLLFGRGQEVSFRIPQGGSFKATLLGIDNSGRLKVKKSDGATEAYGFNEIRMQL